ncbi:Ppx/GppA phosphatase family protein [Glutamicibacter halophytocola]|uniref:Ppx/GppA phosphatase family protein n=1 Tax=Glutamicibacter halophytocola TaxID=1933880 RepID=UPI00321BBDB0
MRLGVLDIGSNTVHLLLVDAYPGARPVPYASHKRPLSLVRYLNEYGAITEEGQQELISFINEAVKFAGGHQVEDFMAFCTSAIRESSNGSSVLDRVKTETGVSLLELTGEEEAGMTFYSVRRWFGWSSESILNLDMGGGSLELAWGTDEFPQTAYSVPLGAGRLTREWLPNDLPSIKEVKELRTYVRDVLSDPATELRQYGKPTLATATSKTFRSLARITGAAPSDEGPYVKRVLNREALKLWTNRLTAMSWAERAELPGVSEIRAPRLLAGAIVAHEAMSALKLKSMRICPWAIREGLMLRRFDHVMFDSATPLSSSVGVGEVALAHEKHQFLAEPSN